MAKRKTNKPVHQESRGTLPPAWVGGRYLCTMSARMSQDEWDAKGRPLWCVRYKVPESDSPDGFVYSRTCVPLYLNLAVTMTPPILATAVQVGYSFPGVEEWQDPLLRAVDDMTGAQDSIVADRRGRCHGPTHLTWNRSLTADTVQSYSRETVDQESDPPARRLVPVKKGGKTEWVEAADGAADADDTAKPTGKRAG